MPANFPSSPTLNQTYSYNGSTWSWTGSYWRLETSQAMTGIAFTYGNAAPSSPNVGDRWIDTTTMLELVYVYDGNSYQWVELSSQAPSTNLAAVSTSITPTANVAYDLGSSTKRWRDLYLSGNSLIIGGATITATGSAIALPSGTTVGGQSVASGGDVATGGGPKITNLQITDNSWTVLDDTAVDTAGGYVLITGTNFVSGAQVYLNQTAANSVAFVSATTLRVTVPALTAGTYIVYVINPDGGTAIRVPGLTASANPAWQTASALPEQYDGVAISLSLVATDATTYTLTSGSLPPGLSLNTSTGAITGTVTGVTVDTTYTFTVRATDAQLQDSPRTFTVTITVSDPYFKLTTLLLSGAAISANTVIRDSSTNNFNLTVAGDARASNFTPYGTGWSVYFDGSGDYLELATNTAFDLPGDYTIEFWMYLVELTTNANYYVATRGTYQSGSQDWFIALDQANKGISFVFGPSSSIVLYAGVIPVNTWTHVAFSRSGSTARSFLNGVLRSSITDTTNLTNTRSLRIGADSGATINNLFSGYLSNWRIIKGTALYTANFTPATTNLTSVANTSILTCNVNRFLDSSTNNFAITRNGDARVVSFNPFNITNTGVDGSMYFDGTGDYVQVANSANLAVGAGDFTIECWVNTSTFSLDTYYRRVFTFGPDAANNLQLLFFDGTNAVSTLSVYSNTILINGTITVANGAWHHVAVCRSGTSLKLFVDGVQSGSTATTSQNFDSAATNGLYIGRFSLAGGHFLGFMSDFRVVKGTALYTTTFTPPTSPLTAVANTQLLTLQYDQPHNNHTFLDSSSNQFLITRNGNASQGTFSPFSQTGWGNYFNGSGAGAGAALSFPANAAFSFSGDFTIEFWIYPLNNNNTSPSIFLMTLSGPTYLAINCQAGSYLSAFLNTSGAAFTSTDQVPAVNAWSHVALVRSGSTVKFYVNGVASSSTATNSSTLGSSTVTPFITNSSNTTAFYISNFRITNGQSLYTTNFTPTTSPLTTTSQGATAGNVKLLTCQNNRFIDNSSNNFSVTLVNSPSVQAFSPFAPTAVYNPVIHGGSGYFNGVSYLSIANTALIQPSAKDFTFECWFYQTQSSLGTLFAFGNPGIYAPLNVYVSGTGINVPLSSTGSSWDIEADTSITAPSSINSWNHIAVSRTSSTVRVFLNGTVIRTTTGVGTLYTPTEALKLGARVGNDTPFYGYISGWRWSVGTGFYTSNFTPSTSSITATTNTQLLLNFTDSAILDSTGRTVIETVADAKSSSVITKFTGGSMYFDGTGDYLQSSAPLGELVFLHNGTSWTVDGWFYTGSTSLQTILSTDAASATIGMTIALNDTNTRDIVAYIYRGVSGSWVPAISPTNSWNLNTWTHFAVTFDSSKNLTVYINGVQVATASGSSFAFSSANPSYPLVVGRYQAPTPGGYFNGYISDLRVTRGYARYTGNFTAPTVPARLK